MRFEDINFPVYRKYKNGLSYFKILSPEKFEEVQVIGSRKLVSVTEARLFPEKSFIYDLTISFQEMAYEISEAEYNKAKGS